MEEQKKILLLCGGRFAFKAIQLLAHENFLYAVGIGKGSAIIVDSLESECKNREISFYSFPRKENISEMKNWINEIKPDYIFSVSFPYLIPEAVLAYGEDKFINFHPGPLPQYRGVMPLFEVLKNQENQTAICAHFMNSKFDEGNIVFNDPIPIEEEETYGSLTVKLSNRMAQVVVNMANMVQFANKIPSVTQNNEKAYYYEKPTFSDTYINWKRMSAEEIIALVHACNPWNNGADTTFMGEPAKIIEAKIHDEFHDNAIPGTILSLTNNYEIHVACSDNKQIRVTIIKTEEGIESVKQLSTRISLISKSFH